jgi:hypothetical protein
MIVIFACPTKESEKIEIDKRECNKYIKKFKICADTL